jgi:hypothetical protein
MSNTAHHTQEGHMASKAVPSFTSTTRKRTPWTPARRKAAAAKAAKARKAQTHRVKINGKLTTVNGSQLAGLKAAANRDGKAAAAKAAKTRKANAKGVKQGKAIKGTSGKGTPAGRQGKAPQPTA